MAESAVQPVAAELGRSGEYPWSVAAALREADLMGIWVPEEYGGRGRRPRPVRDGWGIVAGLRRREEYGLSLPRKLLPQLLQIRDELLDLPLELAPEAI